MSEYESLVETLPLPLRIVGDDTVVLTPDDIANLPFRSREIEIVCNSGDRSTDRWQGVPVLDLLDRAGVPAETTHLLVASFDGYQVCIGVDAALDGLLAIGRNGTSLAEVAEYETRFVSSGTDGPRTVKAVDRIETRSLAPEEDPSTYERLDLDG